MPRCRRIKQPQRGWWPGRARSGTRPPGACSRGSPACKLEGVVRLLGLGGGGGDGADDCDASAAACGWEQRGNGGAHRLGGPPRCQPGAEAVGGGLVPAQPSKLVRLSKLPPPCLPVHPRLPSPVPQPRPASQPPTGEGALEQAGELGVAEGDVGRLALAQLVDDGAQREQRLVDEAALQPLAPIDLSLGGGVGVGGGGSRAGQEGRLAEAGRPALPTCTVPMKIGGSSGCCRPLSRAPPAAPPP